MKHSKELKAKFIQGVLGFTCGDALGVPVEFSPREYCEKYPVKDMLGHGMHDQPKGTWSDDSSMMFCTIEVFNNYTQKKLATKFADWLTKNTWTPHGRVFDVGITTSKAVNNFIDTGRISGATNEFENGNGSLMRMLPLAYYLFDATTEKKLKIISEVSSITHAQELSIQCCVFYVEMAINLLKGLKPIEAYHKTIEFFKSVYSNEQTFFKQILKGDIQTLPQSEIQSTGYVLHTLEASLWCLLNSKNYTGAVLTAVNLGYDTDTTGAVTGGLAGIYYEDTPSQWISKLSRLKDIQALLNKV